MKNKITKDTTLAEVLKFKEAQEILAEYQLPCLYCPMARFEMENLTLKEVCQRYNIKINNLLKDLNYAFENKKFKGKRKQ